LYSNARTKKRVTGRVELERKKSGYGDLRSAIKGTLTAGFCAKL